MGSELIRDHAIGESRTIGKPTFYGPGTLRRAHVDFENDATAFLSGRLSCLISEKILLPTPVRGRLFQEALISPGKRITSKLFASTAKDGS